MAISSNMMLGILSMDAYNRAADGTGFIPARLLDATTIGDTMIVSEARNFTNLPFTSC